MNGRRVLGLSIALLFVAAVMFVGWQLDVPHWHGPVRVMWDGVTSIMGIMVGVVASKLWFLHG